MRNFLRRLSVSLNFGMDRIVPDSFIFAIALTFIVFLMGMGIAGKDAFSMVKYWAEGFWKFLGFSMQMVLVLTTGFTLATTPIGQRTLTAVARIPKTAVSGTIFILVVSTALSWISWGIGMIGGALLAREMVRNLPKVDFKLLIAAGYTGQMLGCVGISVTEALLVNTPGHFLQKEIGLIPMSKTVFSAEILVPLLISGLVVLPLLYWAIHPDDKDTPVLSEALKAKFDQEAKIVSEQQAAEKAAQKEMTIAERIDNSPVVNIFVSLMGFTYIIYWFYTKGFNLNLDIFNFTLLFLGILLHWTPKRLLAAFEMGVKASYGIVLQFPFYAGIQGMMGSSGLVAIMAGWFVAISTPTTFPMWTYMSAALVNLFIPSSGGIFMIQGPVMIKAGATLGVPAPTIVNAFLSGEVISNMIQPFWAIPLLGIVGLKMRDIMGFCILSFTVASIIFCITFLVL